MATALQQQLAAIAANSTHQLDLKAQKARHSKSLLFEPRDAATQSFDTIYQICYEGFEELCMLDARFGSFGRNLFSDQSKNEDRTQMTAAENDELDKTIESFLGLVGGRLLLKPAMTAVEWLVRRFRVQEYNTEAMLLTFLPYHTSHIFPTLLSILPEQPPPIFRFLHPYVASLQSPPRHAVLAAAINNQGFFSAFSNYVLRAAKARHHSAVLLGFWASITAQAVNGMIDASRSGRDAIRTQREEDILLRVLPLLQSALSIKGVPELYLGSCMIMTIFATKASLSDKVLDAMMEAVAGAWTAQTLDDGLTCLAVMAEEKEDAAASPHVVKAILKVEDSVPRLEQLSQRHRVDRLVLGMLETSLRVEEKSHYSYEFAQAVIERRLLSRSYLMVAFERILTEANDRHDECAVMLVREIGADEQLSGLLQKAAQQTGTDLRQLGTQLAITGANVNDEAPSRVSSEDVMDVGDDEQDVDDNVESAISALPELRGKHPSFLDTANDEVYQQYLDRFQRASLSSGGVKRVFNRKRLQAEYCLQEPTMLSLLARVWTSSQQASARSTALEIASAALYEQPTGATVDLQMLLPYLVAGLADTAPRARRAAANACKAVQGLYGADASKEKVSKDVKIWCASTLYSQDSSEIATVLTQDACRFITSSIMPMLEDCVVDGNFVLRALSEKLRGSAGHGHTSSGKESKELKAALRSDVCVLLASHAVATPVYRTKLLLFELLSKIDKTAGDARKRVLLPFVQEWSKQPRSRSEAALASEGLSKTELDHAIIGSLSGRSSEELRILQSVATGEDGSVEEIRPLPFLHLRHLWVSMKTPSQVALADWLLELSVGDSESQGDALDTLRNLPYPTEVLTHLMDTLPSASDLQDQPSSAKKQRTSKADSAKPRQPDSAKLNSTIRRITLVLELVEGAKPEKHPELLKALFHLLSELRHYQTLLGSQLVYLQGLLLSNLLSVVKGLQANPAADTDRSVIRTDLIVDCVRTTSSTQVHNSALLLISAIASWAPELVLHSVMPLFTFMSTTLLRQSDEFSAHVTDQTVTRIVPPLAASLKKRGKDLVSGASELLLSFTAAFEHIPLHRRNGLFQHLVQTLGPEDSLFAVAAMLVERYPSDNRVQPFVSELMGHFAVATQLKAFTQYLDLVFDARKTKRGLSDVILAMGEKDAEQIEDSVDALLQPAAYLFSNTTLRKRLEKALARGGDGAEELKSTYARLLDQTMQLNRDLSSSPLKKTADSVLSALLGLTPTQDFIESSAQLMQSGSDATREQVFRALESRVAQAKRGDTGLQQTFLEVLPNCCVFVQSDHPVSVRRAAINCVDEIVGKYGKRDRSAVLEAAKTIAADAALGSDDASLQVISTLSLASMVDILGDEFISILPQILNKVLYYLQEAQRDDQNNSTMQYAAFTFAFAVLDHLPSMYSDSYLIRTFKLAGNAVMTGQQTVEAAAQQFCALAARQVKPDTILSVVDDSFEDVVEVSSAASMLLLDTLQQCIKNNKQDRLRASSRILFNVILKAFDLRRTQADQDGYDAVFAKVDQVAMDMTLKLSDTLFRPFFIRMVEWATSGLPKKEGTGRLQRQISLYSFARLLFENLRSVVTSYASFLLENASDLLETLEANGEVERLLLETLLQALGSNFGNDEDDFWQAPAHFDAIATPLLSQLPKAKTFNVVEHVIPAITDFAGAAVSPEHHKAMNTTIMSYMRHELAEVRLAAVKCERAVTERLGLDWLSLLPEMLPFISELQEDDNENVERETLRWVRQIEEVTGESLEGMLQ